MELKKQYRAKIVKYNFSEAFNSDTKIFDCYPTNNELLELVEEFNIEYPREEHFETRVFVTEEYAVIKNVNG